MDAGSSKTSGPFTIERSCEGHPRHGFASFQDGVMGAMGSEADIGIRHNCHSRAWSWSEKNGIGYV